HFHLAPLEDVRRLQEEALLDAGWRLPPRRKCVRRGLHRSLRVLACRGGDRRHRLAGERITVRVGGAVRRADPLAADELPVFLRSGLRRRLLVGYDCAHRASSLFGMSVAPATHSRNRRSFPGAWSPPPQTLRRSAGRTAAVCDRKDRRPGLGGAARSSMPRNAQRARLAAGRVPSSGRATRVTSTDTRPPVPPPGP